MTIFRFSSRDYGFDSGLIKNLKPVLKSARRAESDPIIRFVKIEKFSYGIHCIFGLLDTVFQDFGSERCGIF